MAKNMGDAVILFAVLQIFVCSFLYYIFNYQFTQEEHGVS